MSERKALPLQTRLAELAGINVEQRTAEMVWSTGAAVDRMDWWTGERYVEELSLDLRQGHLLGRLDDLAPRNPVLPPIIIRPFVAVVAPEGPPPMTTTSGCVRP